MIRTHIKTWLRQEREKLVPMTPKEKWEYIWFYYKWWILGFVLLLYVIGSGVQNYQYQHKQVLISGIFINTSTSPEGYSFVKEDYWSFCGGEKNTRAELVEVRSIRYDVEQPTSVDVNALMNVDTMIATGDLDYIICDLSAAEFYGRQDYCMDLSQLLPEGKWNLLQTEGGCTAIDLTGSRLEQEYGLLTTPSYIMFPQTAPDFGRCKAFLDYLFAS